MIESINIIAQIVTVYIITRVITYQFPKVVSCRLCLGFWVSLISCIVCRNYPYVGLVYGVSYFMACLERK